MQTLHADTAISLVELVVNPAAIIELAEAEPVAIIAEDHAIAYVLSADYYERLLHVLDGSALSKILHKRQCHECIKVDIDESTCSG